MTEPLTKTTETEAAPKAMSKAERGTWWVSAGFSVFPVTSHKKPLVDAWKPYQDRPPTAEEINGWCERWPDLQWGIACGPVSNLTVVDTDSPEAEEVVRSLIPEDVEPVAVRTASPGHAQFWFRCDLDIPQTQVNPKLRPDPKDRIDIRNVGGYTVAPGSRAYKKDAAGFATNELGRYQFVHPKEGAMADHLQNRPALPAALKTHLLATRTTNAVGSAPPPEFPPVQDGERVAIGQRDDFLFNKALAMADAGLPRDIIERAVAELLEQHCDHNGDDPVPAAKVTAALKWRAEHPKKEYKPQAADTPVSGAEQKQDPTMSFADLRRLEVHVEWDVEDLVPENALTVLYGRTSVGKSWLSLQIAEAVASGAPIFGRRTKQRPVIYCDYENPLAVMKDRAEVLRMENPNARLWHSTMDPGPPKLDSDGWELYKTTLPPGSLLFLDTSRTIHDGNDDSSETAAKVMGRLRILRDLGHTVVILHHTPKRKDREIKASGAWADLADHTLCFYKLKGRGSQEEDPVGDIPLGSPLCVATGKKTRYSQTVPIYLSLAHNQGLVVDEDPDAETLDELARHIAGEGRDASQSAVIKWLQELRRNQDSKRTISREAVLRLLNRGEAEQRWLGRSEGTGKPKRYKPLKEERP